jgi:hypothetical protein
MAEKVRFCYLGVRHPAVARFRNVFAADLVYSKETLLGNYSPSQFDQGLIGPIRLGRDI